MEATRPNTRGEDPESNRRRALNLTRVFPRKSDPGHNWPLGFGPALVYYQGGIPVRLLAPWRTPFAHRRHRASIRSKPTRFAVSEQKSV